MTRASNWSGAGQAGMKDLRNRIRPTQAGPRKSPEDLGDPARGEKVPRCRSCGLPDQPGNRLLPGLWAYIRFTITYELCERCIRSAMPDRLGLDPLTLDDVA